MTVGMRKLSPAFRSSAPINLSGNGSGEYLGVGEVEEEDVEEELVVEEVGDIVVVGELLLRERT